VPRNTHCYSVIIADTSHYSTHNLTHGPLGDLSGLSVKSHIHWEYERNRASYRQPTSTVNSLESCRKLC